MMMETDERALMEPLSKVVQSGLGFDHGGRGRGE